MFLAALALIVVHYIEGNMSRPKPHFSLVHMRMYKGVELLYGNIRNLQYSKKGPK